MGEDFLRRRNDRFIRQRDARFAEEMGPDLFSACRPDAVVNACGTALGDVNSGDELWAPEVDPSGPVNFYRGNLPAVRLDGPAADHVRAECVAGAAPVVAQVVQVERDHGLVTLRIRSKS